MKAVPDWRGEISRRPTAHDIHEEGGYEKRFEPAPKCVGCGGGWLPFLVGMCSGGVQETRDAGSVWIKSSKSDHGGSTMGSVGSSGICLWCYNVVITRQNLSKIATGTRRDKEAHKRQLFALP